MVAITDTIPAAVIRFGFNEGGHLSVTIRRAEYDGALSLWTQANTVLTAWSLHAPQQGGYHKCDFWVRWADGRVYHGTYLLKHYRRETPDLAAHIRRFCEYYSGRATNPPGGQATYARHLAAFGGPDAQLAELLDRYEIGPGPLVF